LEKSRGWRVSNKSENRNRNSLNDDLGLGIPESDDYETLGGFLLSELGSIPKSGDKVKHTNFTFTVTKSTSRSIEEVKLKIKKGK
jgi:CBS domain containing-hemolysin-like protein